MSQAAAKKIMQRIEALARISAEPGRVTRVFASPEMRQANDLVSLWMRDAGMTVRQDAIGNLIGRYASNGAISKSKAPARKILLLGSHLDTVRNAGSFDGPLGVVLAIACVEHLKSTGLRLPFDIEILGFADEEGVRYQSAYLGSRVVAGTFDDTDLTRVDAAGVAMKEAIIQFGGQPHKLKHSRFDGRNLLGYVEAHIEQGPVLERENLAVGIVTAIAGQSRLKFSFIGKAGHAGTTPMRMRQDALCAAADFVLAVEHHALQRDSLVATVGQIQLEPNASNVIPGAAILTLDVRHQTDAIRRSSVAFLQKAARKIAATRKVKVISQIIQQTSSVPCSKPLSGLLEKAMRGSQKRVIHLPSGAGHDAAVLSTITPIAMLFIRCRGGVSHHPDESVALHDVRAAFDVLNDFLKLLANEYAAL